MASIERIKTKLGKKTVIKFPVRYAYFIPRFTKKPSKKKGGKDEFEYDFMGELKPLVVDLKTGVAVENDDLCYKEGYEQDLDVGREPYCPIAANSKDNPVAFNYYKGVRYVKAVQFISILEYKDTGNVCFTFVESNIGWVRSTGRVFNKTTTIYKLTIRHGGKTTLTRDGALLLTNEHIREALRKIIPLMRIKYIARYRGYVILKKMFIKHFLGVEKMSAREFDVLSYQELISIYRVKQNPKLHDLPWSEKDLCGIYRSSLALGSRAANTTKDGERSVSNVKVSLNRYLRRGDTKKAIDACFYGFSYPKSIRRILMKTQPLEFKYKCYENIATIIERYGVDNARNLFTNSDGSPNKDMIANPHYIEMLDLGFSLAQVRQTDRAWMRDTLQMRERLINEGFTLEFNPNINAYHRYLMEIVIDLDREERARRAVRNEEERLLIEQRRAIKREKQRRLEEAYTTIDTSEQSPRFEHEGFVFRSPVNAAELNQVGSKLNICVSMYKEDFFLGRLDIVLVTKQNIEGIEKYIACIEVKRKQIVQAKLNSNRPVQINKPLMKSVRAWAKKQDLALACSDVGKRHNNYVEDNAEIQERVEQLSVAYEAIKNLH